VSYSVNLEVTGGTVTVSSTGGTVPDGLFAISGHEDSGSVSVGVSRTDASSVPIVQASAYAKPTPAVTT
jgi:hypothetical protein